MWAGEPPALGVNSGGREYRVHWLEVRTLLRILVRLKSAVRASVRIQPQDGVEGQPALNPPGVLLLMWTELTINSVLF